MCLHNTTKKTLLEQHNHVDLGDNNNIDNCDYIELEDVKN